MEIIIDYIVRAFCLYPEVSNDCSAEKPRYRIQHRYLFEYETAINDICRKLFVVFFHFFTKIIFLKKL